MTVFTWPGFGRQPNFRGLQRVQKNESLIWSFETKTGTAFFHWLVGHTVLQMRGHYPSMISVRFNIFSNDKLDNTSLFLNRRLLQHACFHRQNRVNLTALFIRTSTISCVCGSPRILRSTMKIPIASLGVWLRSPLATWVNFLTITFLRRFLPFHLNTLCILRTG